MAPLRLPSPIQRRVEDAARADVGRRVPDRLRHPARRTRLTAPGSVSWRLFKNPISLFMRGGRLVQPVLVKAAVDLLPEPLKTRLGLETAGLSQLDRGLVRAMAKAADRLVLESAPPARACIRMGLPADWLYRPPETSRAF